jgi:hypothetical protein
MRSAVFQPGEREVGLGAAEHRARQDEALRLAALRLALDLRAARVGKAEQLRGLVEGFADRVVDRGAEAHVAADVEHCDDLRMAAGGEEQAIRKSRVVGQPRGQRMRFKVIDGDQRLLGDQRDRLRGGQAHDHAADQPRPGRRRDPVEHRESSRSPRSSRA